MECLLFSKADVHLTNIRMILGSAYGQERTFRGIVELRSKIPAHRVGPDVRPPTIWDFIAPSLRVEPLFPVLVEKLLETRVVS